MYLLLASIVLLLLFAASYGGRRSWLSLISTAFSVLVLACGLFVLNAHRAGPYFTGLAVALPPISSQPARDLGMAATQLTNALALARQNAIARQTAQQNQAPTTGGDLAKQVHSGQWTFNWLSGDWFGEDWLSGDWLNADWFDTGIGSLEVAWLDPRSWFGGNDAPTDAMPASPMDGMATRQEKVPSSPSVPPGPQQGEPNVIVLAPRQSHSTPSHKLVIAPAPSASLPNPSAAVTTSIPVQPDAPVKWYPDAPPPKGETSILLTGANVSDMPLEDIQATLKPDSQDAALGIEGLALSLKVERSSSTGPARASNSATVPPGMRFYLEASSLSEQEIKQLGGAIVSFAYSQDGRRRTSILYLEQVASAKAE